MTRRTHAQVATEATKAERAACIDHLRGKIVEVDRLCDRGRITAEEASLLTRRLDAVADELGQGLHVPDGRPIQANRGRPAEPLDVGRLLAAQRGEM